MRDVRMYNVEYTYKDFCNLGLMEYSQGFTIPQLESMLFQCFENAGIGKCVDRWLGNCRRLCNNVEEHIKCAIVTRLWQAEFLGKNSYEK